ncbi:hypothetical protein [Pseudobacteriovorax antillogorgiicola]|uniref:Lipoprotein amino terminal region n=1 Tax=Pseudobacteriovorax antillogorgiicola TaxID=1513793 RepID=A0A1Y6C7D3_9BACT|nr:hypothetical protein [Pseudobacteriovorax antillogorgiicola]TCS51669.1 lipoprotein [Pseudobacteriovorax antillogorgiicola]SMF48964.1 Lipoprotein amino terminal region [Pseudobacteriovorax antillogorgiicola]
MFRALIAGFALVVAALVTFIVGNDSPKNDGLNATKDLPRSIGSLVHRCQEGHTRKFSVDYESQGTLSFKSDQDQQSAQTELTWDGQLTEACLSDSQDESLVFLKLTITNWQDNILQEKDRHEVRKALMDGIFIRYHSHSFEIYSLNRARLAANNQWFDLAMMSFKCIAPAARSSISWSCHESSPKGDFEARYLKSGEILTKQYSWQDHFASFNEVTLKIEPKSHSMVIGQTQTQGLASYLGSVRIQVNLDGHSPLNTEDRLALITDSEAASLVIFRQDRVRTTQEVRERQQKILGSDDLETLWQVAEPNGNHFLKMVSWLQLNPSYLDTLKNKLFSEAFGKQSKMWLKALSKAGSDAAQATLVDFIKAQNGLNEASRYALVALAGTTQPSLESESFLKTTIETHGPKGLGRSASYSLGIMANQSPRQDQIQEFFEDKLDKASDQDLIVYLRSIGNMKTPSSLAVMQRYLDHPSRQVRGDAIFGMRFFPEAYPALMQKLQSEDSHISSQAGRALGFQLNSANQLQEIFKQWAAIPAPKVRSQLLTKIIGHKEFSKVDRNLLNDILALETNPAISQKIEEALASH